MINVLLGKLSIILLIIKVSAMSLGKISAVMVSLFHFLYLLSVMMAVHSSASLGGTYGNRGADREGHVGGVGALGVCGWIL